MKPTGAVRQEAKSFGMSVTVTRSCGRLGPDTQGTTVDRSSSSTVVKFGSGSSAA